MTPEALEMSKKYAARVMELEKEVVTLKNKIKESGRYKLRKQVAALTKERDEANERSFGASEAHVMTMQKLIAAQATNAKLRSVLTQVREQCLYIDGDGAIGVTQEPTIDSLLFDDICKSLALSNDTTALNELLKKEREKCAMLAQVAGAMHVADTIRSMT